MVSEVNRPGEFIKTLLRHLHTCILSLNSITKNKRGNSKEKQHPTHCQENIRNKKQTKQIKALACDARIQTALIRSCASQCERVPANIFLLH